MIRAFRIVVIMAALLLPGPLGQDILSSQIAHAQEGCGIVLVGPRCCWRPLLRPRILADCCYPPLLPRVVVRYRCCQPVPQAAPSASTDDAGPQPTPAVDENGLDQPPQDDGDTPQDPDSSDDPDSTDDPDKPETPDPADDSDDPPATDAPGLKPATPGEPVTIDIQLPADATLSANGKSIHSQGSHRQIVALLGHGESLTLRASIVRAGEKVTQQKTIVHAGGEQQSVRFDLLTSGSISTTLRLHVPPTAEVRLQGQLTSSAGVQRVFKTHQLGQGETWRDYLVEVRQVVDGQSVITRRRIDLVGGRSHELVFPEPQARVAGSSR